MNANLIGFGWKEKIYLGPTNLEFVNMGRLVIYFIINNKGSTSEHQTRVPKYVVQLYWNINQRAKNQSAKKCLKNIAYLHNYIGTKYFAFIKSYLFWWGQFWTGPQPLFASSHWDNYPSLARPIAAFLYKKTYLAHRLWGLVWLVKTSEAIPLTNRITPRLTLAN